MPVFGFLKCYTSFMDSKKGWFLNFVFLSTFAVFSAGSFSLAKAQTQPPLSPQERAQLEIELGDLERQIADHEATIEKYRKQGSSLKGEIGSLNAKIEKLNLQIKAVSTSALSSNELLEEIFDLFHPGKS
jgi:peptidoglycan hydrolase CwlO-like protein